MSQGACNNEPDLTPEQREAVTTAAEGFLAAEARQWSRQRVPGLFASPDHEAQRAREEVAALKRKVDALDAATGLLIGRLEERVAVLEATSRGVPVRDAAANTPRQDPLNDWWCMGCQAWQHRKDLVHVATFPLTENTAQAVYICRAHWERVTRDKGW